MSETSNGQLLPPEGSGYVGTLVGSFSDKSKVKGTPYIGVVFRISMPSGGTIERTVQLWLSPGAIEYTEEKLERMGFNGDVIEPDFKVKEMPLTCRHEEYQGSKRDKWDLSPARGSPQVASEVAQEFAQRFRERFGPGVGARAAPPPPGPVRPQAATAPSRPVSPAPARPAAPAAKLFGMDEAWDAWAKECPPSQAPDPAMFFKAIDDVRGNVPEDKMTEDHWRQVAAAFMPF